MTAGYPSEEPIAGKPHDGICGGESQQWLSYPTNLCHFQTAKQVGHRRAASASVAAQRRDFPLRAGYPNRRQIFDAAPFALPLHHPLLHRRG
jgi:hypothetical protein